MKNLKHLLITQPLRYKWIVISFLVTASLAIHHNNCAQHIIASDDSYITNGSDGELSESNWGVSSNLLAGERSSQVEHRIFIKFNLSQVNPGVIKSATIRLYFESARGMADQYLGIHNVEKEWFEVSEDTEGKNNKKGITWSNQPIIDSDPIVIFHPGHQASAWTEIEITSIVKAWLSGTPNYGIAIVKAYNLSEIGECEYKFSSRESENKYQRPMLILNVLRESKSFVDN